MSLSLNAQYNCKHARHLTYRHEHAFHVYLISRTDQPDKAWENEQRQQAKAEARHPTANAHIERLAEIQNDPTMQGYLDRPSRGEERQERTRSSSGVRNPDAHALINKIAAIANDRTMDGPAADRAINTLMTEHQRGTVDRGDVYGNAVRDQRGARASDLTYTRDFGRAATRKRETIRSAGKTREDRDFGHGD